MEFDDFDDADDVPDSPSNPADISSVRQLTELMAKTGIDPTQFNDEQLNQILEQCTAQNAHTSDPAELDAAIAAEISELKELAQLMSKAGIDISQYDGEQLRQILDHFHNSNSEPILSETTEATRPKVHFRGWEKDGGYWYEYDPDRNYTGRWDE